MNAAWALFFNEALETEIEELAAQLAGEGEEDFDFACGEDQGRVDDTESLGQEGEVCADKGDIVSRVLRES